MIAFPKSGDFISKTLRTWTKGRPCAFCDAPPPSDPHHHPSRGSMGCQWDLLIVAACRSCHRRADGQTVGGLPPIPKEEQTAKVLRNLVTFIRACSHSEFAAFCKDIAKAKSRLLF